MNEDLEAREIAREQEFVHTVYRQLERSTASAAALMREGNDRGRLGHEGGLVERDAMVYQAARRVATLDAAHEGLVFGRLDLRADVDAEPRYVGRIGLRDDQHEVLLIDWRAPAAAVFYQATAATPRGVVRRRILRSRGESVIGVEDDLLDPEAEEAERLPIVGEGALMAQLSRKRDRTMHSIVASIQAEQDEAIRAPQKGVVTIGGGPGTGKTVVALHRVAFLLYGDRRRYEKGGVLVVGPSGVFMRYIERVLPSLGETAVALRSLGEVVDGVRAARRDEPAVAEVKGSAALAEVLRRTARLAVPGAPETFEYFYRDSRIVLGRRELERVRRRLLSMGRRNRSTAKVASTLIEAMWPQVTSERGRERGREDFAADLRTDDRFLEFAAAWWPVLDAPTVLGWLRDPELLQRVGRGVLNQEQILLLTKSWGETLSVDDVPLVDELRYLLGDPPLATGEDADPLDQADSALQEVVTAADREYAGPAGWRPPTNRVEDDGYAHVLIDEAQDLTPMQWRMVGRRGRTATWTIVGDPAQSSWPVPAEAQAARAEALGSKRTYSFHLSTNYRNSAEIYEHAAAYARSAGLDADLPQAIRSTGVAPREATVEDLEAGLRAELSTLAGAVEGTVGVVVPMSRQGEISRLVASWPEFSEDLAGGDRARIAVLTGLDTKGLEFDGVLVVQPEEIERESPTGRATLYVVLTRATQLLTTLTLS